MYQQTKQKTNPKAKSDFKIKSEIEKRKSKLENEIEKHLFINIVEHIMVEMFLISNFSFVNFIERKVLHFKF